MSITMNKPPAGRFLGNLPVTIKLVAAFVLVVAIAVAAVIYIANRTASEELVNHLSVDLASRGQEIAIQVNKLLGDEEVDGLQVLAINKSIQDLVVLANTSYIGNEAEIQAGIDALDRQWAEATDSDGFIQSRLDNDIASELREFRVAFPNHVELFVTDRYGGLLGATNRTSDYYQADEAWWQAAWNNGAGQVYIGQPELDESAGTASIIIAMPIFDHNPAGGQTLQGILRSTLNIQSLQELVSRIKVGSLDSIDADLHFGNGTVIESEGTTLGDTKPAAQELLDTLPAGTVQRTTVEGETRFVNIVSLSELTDRPYLQDLNWKLIISDSEVHVLEPVSATVRSIVLAGLVVIIGSVVLALFFARFIASPIRSLTQTAQQFASGNLSQRSPVSGSDELGTLSTAFNQMAEQLQELVDSLEERVNARTRDLQIVNDVGTQVATILEPERLLRDISDLTKERFGLYHSHIYLLNDSGDTLVLTAGAGYVGRQMVSEHRIIAYENPQSIVAQAARSRRAVIVDDVRQSPTFLPHKLLPDTRSEMAVPLVARGQLLGVLDVQSNQVGYFDENALATFELMAGQISVAISNAQLYTTAERTSRHERALGQIDRSIQSANNMDEILQATVRELGKALRVPYTAIEIQQLSNHETDEVMS